MSDPSWAHGPQSGSAGRDAFNIGRDQVNQVIYEAESRGLHMDPSSMLSLIDSIKDRLRVAEETERRELVSGYERRIEQALGDFKSLQAQSAILQLQNSALVSERLRLSSRISVLEGQLEKAQGPGKTLRAFWWQIGLASVLLMLIGASFGLQLAGGDDAQEKNDPPSTQMSTPPAQTPTPSGTSASTDSASGQPEDYAVEARYVVDDYFLLGDQQKGDAMLELITPHFLKVSGGRQDYLKNWNGDFEDIDALVSAGRPPIVKNDGETVYVQVAWRYKDQSIKDIRTKEFYLSWFEMVRTANGYKLNRNLKASPKSSCSSNDVVRCAQQDDWQP